MKSIYAAFAVLLLCGGGAQAATADAMTVVKHHSAVYANADLEGILSDYAPDAVVVSPSGMMSANGIFVGIKQVRALFTTLTSPANAPSNKGMDLAYTQVAPDTIMMHVVQMKGTPKEYIGHDVFVVRGGKIVYQSIWPDHNYYPDPKK